MLKTIYHGFTTLILIILVALVAILFLPRLLGMQPLAVLSGSMEPTYHVGSLVYVKKCEPTDVQLGDPITFKISEDTMVTHRVVGINPVEQSFYTKGDANDNVDGGSVSFTNLVGRPAFTIPLLGYLAVYAQTKTGMIILVTVIIALLILTFLPDLFKDDEEETDREEKQNEKHRKHKKKN